MQQQVGEDNGALSGAAELAIAAMLLRAIPQRAWVSRRTMNSSRPPATAQQEELEAKMGKVKEIWEKKYVPARPEPAMRTIIGPDGAAYEVPADDHIRSESGELPGIDVRLNSNKAPDLPGRNYFSRGRPFERPLVVVTANAHPATLAHEMGHAELYASANQLNGAASDLVARIQEDQIDWLPSKHTLARGAGARNWPQVLLPAAGAVAGLGTGALLGDNGALPAALIGGATGLPLLVVEAEAWRRGAEYAKALGVSRRRYAAQAVLPLLAYASLGASNAALGALASELSSDVFRGEAG